MAGTPLASGTEVHDASKNNRITIEKTIETHPLTLSLRQNPHYTESRPHQDVPVTMRAHNLMAGTLAGPHRISVAPYIFNDDAGKSMTMIMHLGSDICGHPGIIHGGLLAALLDEGLARCCFAALPGKVGVTANLNVDYRHPAPADSFFVLEAVTVKVEGRKAWVEGRIETLPVGGDDAEPVLVVEARALFIEPRQAAVSLLLLICGLVGSDFV